MTTLPSASALRAALAAGTALERHLPAPLLAEGPQGLHYWQWLAIPAFAAIALAIGAVLGILTRRVLQGLAARTRATWDDAVVARLGTPLALIWAIAVFTALRPSLDLHAEASDVVSRMLRAATYLVAFWAGFRAVDTAFGVAATAPWTKENVGLAGILPLGRRIAKIALLGVGVVSVLTELGFRVESLIAGLGVGGIALALAAQKTVENLFGSLSIGVDQPFRVGDYVSVDGVSGTVEAIGMRSTRIRTLERTVVTFPNGRLADLKAESFAPRDRFRILANLGLVYGTTEAQLREVLAGVEQALREHPRVVPDGISVRFTEFRESSLNVEVVAYLQTTDFGAFTAARQDLFLKFLAVVERAGTSLAFPTRTVLLQDGRDANASAEKKTGPANRARP
jgi:MscS family membrane protein